VAGDPFEPELAAAAAATPEAAAIDALDELLQLDLIRSTDVPRRFRFRHPLVRRAVYETTVAAWRLGAHERCAQALAARGASAAARAHHVERSAREGDLAAVAVLREAGEGALRLAPTSAARWFAEALRLLPATTPSEERTGLLLSRAEALMADGHFAEGHETLFAALAGVPSESSTLRVRLTASCARVEHLLGRYAEAGARLHRELDALAEPISPEAASLLIELALENLLLTQYEEAREWAGQALEITRSLGEHSLHASALAMVALADAMRGAGERAEAGASEAGEVMDALADDELATGLDAAVWLAAAEFYADRYAESEAHIERALAVARASGQGELLLFFLYLQGRVLYMRGKLTAAAQLIDAAIEAARLLGNREVLAWSLYNRSAVALASGDFEFAFATANESADLTREVQESYVTAWAGVRLAMCLFEGEQPAEAVEVLLGSVGGEEMSLIPAGWRGYCLVLLIQSYLANDRGAEAERAAELAEACASAVQLPMARVWAARARGLVELHAGDLARAAEHALASAATAEEVGAPIEAALARTLAGRALAQAGQHDSAIAELQHAVAALDGCGARRYRDQAERELGKLGHRLHRRSQPGKVNGNGIETLTARELQVAQLVVDRRTNPEIAAQLFLSNKTVESHLRNIFRKMNVASRVELARTVERATWAASPPQS
jgi:DNA-binding NarL/FixJ family response regulator